MKKVSLFLIVASALVILSCSKDSTCNTTGVTYTNTVKAIFDKSCIGSGCHNTGSPNGSLVNYADSKAFPNLAKMVGALKQESAFSAMPKTGSKLDDCSISQVAAWIAAGTPQ